MARSPLPILLQQSRPRPAIVVSRIVLISLILLLLFLGFTPWVQTAPGEGQVTALDPADRLQTVNALVSGRINRWYVQDGSHIEKGDPIVEIIDTDPQFAERLAAERDALKQQLEVARIAAETAKIDYHRQEQLYKEGLSSRKEFESSKIAYKKLLAEESKASASLIKGEIQLSRQATQIVRAPRAGTVVQIRAGDEATFIKAGDIVASFIPSGVPQAVELFVSGHDIPLIHPGRRVQLQFEGWPVVQFSGWPALAVGTFSGEVVRVDPTVSPNNRFRILIRPTEEQDWPGERFLRFGAKVKGWVLLNTVPLGYEIWRQLNNFPPEFDAGALQPAEKKP